MLSTVISIFAVDFIVFPRNFAKTETFGISLMDLGVGFFILSNGISASVKRPHISNQISLWKILRSVSPLLVLGGSRFFMVKASNYQEHASEYGTHWNFFMTLAVVASASTFIHSKFPKFPYLLCGISIAAVYETLLTFTRLDDWILNAPRIGFISANKEGISSCMGYMSLYLTSFAIGKSLFKKRNAVQWISLLKKVTAVTVLMWTTWIIILDQNNGLSLLSPPSRRMANLGYTSVVTLLGLSHIIIILWGSLLLPVSQQHPGPISQAINSNQLVFFLISNLLTGAINLSIQTIYRSCSSSMNILTLYLSVLALVAYVGLAFKLKLKFW